MLADDADALMYEMSRLDTENEYYAKQWQKLYEEAEALIEQIYSRKLYAQESEKLKSLAETE